METLLGDASELTRTQVSVSGVLSLQGPSAKGSVLLTELPGIKQYLKGRSLARIVSELKVSIHAAVGADKAAHAFVCLIPGPWEEIPGSGSDILKVAGSVIIQSSLYDTSGPVTLGYPAGVVPQLKPSTLLGEPPRIVYCLSAPGADASTHTELRFTGELQLQGIGFVQTW